MKQLIVNNKMGNGERGTGNGEYLRPCCLLLSSLCLLLTTCGSFQEAGKRLEPQRSTEEIRIEQIKEQLEKDPVNAIHLIGVYKAVYAAKDKENGDEHVDESGEIESIKNEAIAGIVDTQKKAIEEKNWDRATSLARSLAALGISVEKTGAEPDILLQAAKDYLSRGKDLEAFLAASNSNELSPLSAADAMIFLERSFKTKQRRTAHYFLNAAQAARLRGGNNAITIDSETEEFAKGNDTAADMIKGVATVIVDRGIKVQHGMGISDRILGSAFFVDASGLLITNYHVIASEVDPSYEGYSRLYVRLGDSSTPRIPAKVIGWDKAVDLALIKAEIKPEYVFSVIDGVLPKVGETVFAIGSPAGLEKTVTSGIVSTAARRLLQIGTVIQIDAAVNPGNSGGPVVDRDGRIAGVVFAGAEQFEGLNFAIPAARLSAALPAMLRGGKASRPWLGLTLAQTRTGADIIYVAPATPAAEQLIKEGVSITAINGKAISAPQGELIALLQDMLFSDEPGELISLTTSDGKTRIMHTAPRPEMPLAEAAKRDSKERLASPLFGLILEPSVANTIVPSYLITSVRRGSIADEAGLSPQDPVRLGRLVIEEKDGYALLNIEVKKRSSGYLETSMQLPAMLDSPDTL
jgi:S1-C subfamily serine protease